MIKAIFFDFDGVLTPHETGRFTTCDYISKKESIDFEKIKSCYKKFNRNLNIGKITHEEMWGEFCICIGKKLNINILNEAFEATPSNDPIYELALTLKKRYKIGIITDNKKDRMEVIQNKFELDKLFDIIILSADLGFEKDSKELFESALNRLNVKPEECIFIDNNMNNLEVPRKIGFKTIFYNHKINDVKLLEKQLMKFGIAID